MTPRERAEAALSIETIERTECGHEPCSGLRCRLPAGHRCPHYDRKAWDAWRNEYLASHAPALARDLIAAMDEAEKMRAVVEAARLWTDHLDKSGLYRDGVPGELLDALAGLDAAKGGE